MDAVSHRNAEALPDESPNGEHELPKPESCYAAGLECRSCVRNSAANLAQICLDLSVEAVRDSFFKVYPDQACLPMSRTFVRAYRAARALLNERTVEQLDDVPLLAGVPLATLGAAHCRSRLGAAPTFSGGRGLRLGQPIGKSLILKVE